MSEHINVPLFDLKEQHSILKDELLKTYSECMEHGMFIMGPEVKECEQKLSEFCGAKNSVTCSSGTDALRLALMALNIGPGDEVITTAFTFIATVEMILAVGAKPVLVDIDLKTYNILPEQALKAVTPNTKAIIAVSLFGRTAPLSELRKGLDGTGVYLIEDAAQSFGAICGDDKSGTDADITTTSFFPAKPLGCLGDGGAVFTENDDWSEKMKRIRVHGSAKKYHHTDIGIGGRMDSIQCGFLNKKLSIFQNEIDLRNKIAKRYFAELKNIEGLSLPIEPKDSDRHTWAQFTLRHEKRDAIIKGLKEFNVSCSIHYPKTVNSQPAYEGLCVEHSLENSMIAASTVFSIPMHPYLTDEQVEHTIKSLKDVLRNL